MALGWIVFCVWRVAAERLHNCGVISEYKSALGYVCCKIVVTLRNTMSPSISRVECKTGKCYLLFLLLYCYPLYKDLNGCYEV